MQAIFQSFMVIYNIDDDNLIWHLPVENFVKLVSIRGYGFGAYFDRKFKWPHVKYVHAT